MDLEGKGGMPSLWDVVSDQAGESLTIPKDSTNPCLPFPPGTSRPPAFLAQPGPVFGQPAESCPSLSSFELETLFSYSFVLFEPFHVYLLYESVYDPSSECMQL